MPSYLPLRDRIDLWLESQVDDKLPVPSSTEFRRALRLWYGIQRSTQLPFSDSHMKLAAAEGVTAENLPSVLRRVLHKPMEKWLEGRYSDLVTHFGRLSSAEGQGSPTLLIGVHANVLDIHVAEFTTVFAGRGWISVAEDTVIADVRRENMSFQDDVAADLMPLVSMLAIVPTVPA